MLSSGDETQSIVHYNTKHIQIWLLCLFFQCHAVLSLFWSTPFVPPPNSSIFLQKYDGHCGQLRHEQKAFLVLFERPLLFRLWHLECLKWFGLAVFFCLARHKHISLKSLNPRTLIYRHHFENFDIMKELCSLPTPYYITLLLS